MQRVWTLVTLSALVASFGAAPALAQSKKKKKAECIAASEDAQLLKVKGKLLAAREKFVQCSDRSCPGAIRKDCEAGIEELESTTPSVVLGAKDGDGHDLTDVSVQLDGEMLADELDGKAIAVDPGKHTFRFEAEGLPALEKKLVIREGEKARPIVVTLGEKKADKPLPGKKKEEPSGEPSTATWVVGGVGAALLVGAGVVGLVALQKRSSLYDECGKAGTCSEDEVDSVYRLYNVSYVGAGLGGALLATSVVLYLTGSSSKGGTEQKSVFIAPTFGGATVRGRF